MCSSSAFFWARCGNLKANHLGSNDLKQKTCQRAAAKTSRGFGLDGFCLLLLYRELLRFKSFVNLVDLRRASILILLSLLPLPLQFPSSQSQVTFCHMRQLTCLDLKRWSRPVLHDLSCMCVCSGFIRGAAQH